MFTPWEVRELCSLPHNLIMRSVSFCLFHNILSHEPYAKVHILLLSILNSILLICKLLERYRTCTSFGGSITQFWVVLAKLWPFEGWLILEVDFKQGSTFAYCDISVDSIILVGILLEGYWVLHHMVVFFSRHRVVCHRYDDNGRCTKLYYGIWMWSGNTNGLLIPSSSPHRCYERKLHICKGMCMWVNA